MPKKFELKANEKNVLSRCVAPAPSADLAQLICEILTGEKVCTSPENWPLPVSADIVNIWCRDLAEEIASKAAAPSADRQCEFRASEYVEQNPDSKTYTAGIDALRQYPYQDQQWHLCAIEVHHKNKDEAAALRDRIFAALQSPVERGSVKSRVDISSYQRGE